MYAIADPTFPDDRPYPRAEDAGKLMALAGGDGEPQCPRETAAQVDMLLDGQPFYPLRKSAFRGGPLYNAGVDSPVGRAAARYITDAIYDRFLTAARRLAGDVPLLVAGGCGLNCDWNVRWLRSGLFRDVFIPPCTDDSGSAIGTAVDALVAVGEPPALAWSVFRGAAFVQDVQPEPDAWQVADLDHDRLAQALGQGRIVAWVQGRAEIGPRALGHRSLLASAHLTQSRHVLNAVKRREPFRPVAPCCLEEDLLDLFDTPRPDRYMLLFGRVRTDALPGVTHDDGTARPQAVFRDDNAALHALLRAVKARTGQGVLCNTSLNFSGRGFINRTSELLAYCEQAGIADFVLDDRWWQRRPTGLGAVGTAVATAP